MGDPEDGLSRRKFIQGLGAVGAVGLGGAQNILFSVVPRPGAALLGPRAATPKVRIGIVGGNFGTQFQWHLDPDYKPTAYCDLRDDRLANLVNDSHTFLTHEFVRSIIEDRWPTVNVYEALAFTVPGITAHQSALRCGEVMKINDYGKAPA